MVKAIGEITDLNEDDKYECVWCGEEIEHEGKVVQTIDKQPACSDCIEERPWEKGDRDDPLDDIATPISGEQEDEDFREEETDRKP